MADKEGKHNVYNMLVLAYRYFSSRIFHSYVNTFFCRWAIMCVISFTYTVKPSLAFIHMCEVCSRTWRFKVLPRGTDIFVICLRYFACVFIMFRSNRFRCVFVQMHLVRFRSVRFCSVTFSLGTGLPFLENRTEWSALVCLVHSPPCLECRNWRMNYFMVKNVLLYSTRHHCASKLLWKRMLLWCTINDECCR